MGADEQHPSGTDKQRELPDMPTIPQWLSADRRKWEEQWNQAVRQYSNQLDTQRRELINAIELARDNAKLLTFFSKGNLDQSDAEMVALMLQRLAAQEGTEKLDRLDLLLYSSGGFIEPAYKIVGLCRDYSQHKFAVIVPFWAKSAATLIALGADEIVMGPSSELGPLDPQMLYRSGPQDELQPVSALSIRQALEFMEERVARDASLSLLYGPLAEQIDPVLLGYAERAIASSKQHAQELLTRYQLRNSPDKASELANHLTEGYLSHGFVINHREARELGLNVITPTAELLDNICELHRIYDHLCTWCAQNQGYEIRSICEISGRFELRVK